MQVLSTKTQRNLWHKLQIQVISLTKDAHNTLHDYFVIKTSSMFWKKVFAERKENKEYRSNVKMYQPKILLETVLFESPKTIRWAVVLGFSNLLDMIWICFMHFFYCRLYLLIMWSSFANILNDIFKLHPGKGFMTPKYKYVKHPLWCPKLCSSIESKYISSSAFNFCSLALGSFYLKISLSKF